MSGGPGRASPEGARIPSLDGLRAISITFVLLSHLAGTRNFWGKHVDEAFEAGTFGVRVFFVISGFLITSLLLKEHERSGTISLKGFYLRRLFRIFPAYYAYIAVVVALGAFGLIQLAHKDVWFALSYTTNYHAQKSWYLGHAWSLAVEEQFYLLWPLAMKLVGPRRALHVALAVVLISPGLRVLSYVALPEHRWSLGQAFPTIADSIAVGCVLAYARGHMAASTRYQRFASSWAFVLVPLVTLGMNLFTGRKPSIDLTVGQTMMNIGIALTIDWVISRPETLCGRVLNYRPIAFVGVLSYSIYLWQQPFLHAEGASVVTSFPLNLACVAAAALASYYLVEQPFLRLRGRLSSSPARPAALAERSNSAAT